MAESIPKLLFLTHVATTLYMTGLIWFVQVVHYPLFDTSGRDTFSAFAQRHAVLTTRVVAVPMLLEAATAVLLLWLGPQGLPLWPFVVGLVLLAIVWGATAFLQVPCHKRLAGGFDPATHRRLVQTNWIRTAAWTLRALLLLGVAWVALD